MTKLLLLALFILSGCHAKPDDRREFAACPVNHQPQQFCCDHLNGEKYIYTLYRLPTSRTNSTLSRTAEEIIRQGWLQTRKVNSPAAPYTPTTPEFQYGDIETTCRLHRSITEDKVTEKLLCGQELMASELGKDSLDPTLFMTWVANPRNNNASCPFGANFTSLMASDGITIDPNLMATCKGTTQFMKALKVTFLEKGFIAIYSIYGLLLVLLTAWGIMRHRLAVQGDASAKKDIELGNSDNVVLIASAAASKEATKNTPPQKGFADTWLGTLLFHGTVMALLALTIIIFSLCLNTFTKYLGAKWVPDGVQRGIVFMVLLLTTGVIYAAVIYYRTEFRNFFRSPSSLDEATWVELVDLSGTNKDEESFICSSSPLVKWLQDIERRVFLTAANRELVPVHLEDGVRYVEFQQTRYVYEDHKKAFVRQSISMSHIYADIVAAAAVGLSTTEYRERLTAVGPNKLKITMPSILSSIIEELVTIFYLYQLIVYSVLLYLGIWYLVLAFTIIVLSAASVTIYTKRAMRWNIVSNIKTLPPVRVLRDKIWQTVEASMLVPGDLVRVEQDTEVPADMIVVQGAVITDESMLTGESHPVQKFPLPSQSDQNYDKDGESKRHTIFCGTKVLRAGNSTDVHAMVYHTGASTEKGNLLKAILAPKKIGFKYYEHIKLILVLMTLYSIFAAILTLHYFFTNTGISNRVNTFIFVILMFSVCISPLLPVVATLGQLQASRRLHANGIFTLDPERIIFAGKVRVFCFDKTGTLTKQGLDFLGCTEWLGATSMSPILVPRVRRLNAMFQYGLGSCHSLGSLEGELIGNEVEKNMFVGSEYKLVEEDMVESADGKVTLEFLKRYEFDQKRMSMSVIVRHVQANEVYVFCKGSAEKLKMLCTQRPGNSDEVDEEFSSRGCYVLGMGFKKLGKYSPQDQQKWNIVDRDVIEKDLAFLGFMCFRNELKEDTKKAMKDLRQGNTHAVMITGDNVRTAAYIAQDCQMVSSNSTLLSADQLHPITNEIVWTDLKKLRESSFLRESNVNLEDKVYYTTEEVLSMVHEFANVELAVTSQVFHQLMASKAIEALLKHIRIFARMSPIDKRECVGLFMKQNIVTGMCGDGGNDCGALRQAHVGIALSESEASLVSPFASKSKSLSSVVELCCEGRGSIVTSFASVKNLLTYAIVASRGKLAQYDNGIVFAEWQWIVVDIIHMASAYYLTLSRPRSTLGRDRPTGSLIGPSSLSSFLGQVAIHSVFFTIALQYLRGQEWYCPFNTFDVDLTKWFMFSDNTVGTCCVTIMKIQMTISAFVYGFGGEFRLPVWRNYGLMAFTAAILTFDIYTFLMDADALTDRLRIASGTNVIGLPDIPAPSFFRYNFAVILALNILVSVVWEYIVSNKTVRTYFRQRYHQPTLKLKL